MRFSELDGARVGVWGAGREISSFAAQLAKRLPSAQLAVAVFDEPPVADVRPILQSSEARVVGAAEAVAALGDCDVLVRSPGVSIYRPELRALRDAGLAVTTATSLWLAEHGAQGVIGLTGTKGKSTTAALAAHLVRAAGASVALAGNIGVPALELLDCEPTEIVVAELSSYQLADLSTGPEVAVITNLYREHTDWHGSEETYRADKLRILGLPGVRAAVVGEREERVARAHPDIEVRVFGVADGWQTDAQSILLRGERVMSRAELPLHGEHNALNLCAALSALEAAGVSTPPLPQALAGFHALAHRLETVLERDGVTWVDDSISTTPESALAALAAFPEREIVLIGGGQDRGQDYAELALALTRRRASVIGVGSTGPRLIAAARAAGVPEDRSFETADLGGAVARARAVARPGAVVLLSPAAPSYDQFRDFEERGERFRELVTGS